jgi:hypothetical protein
VTLARQPTQPVESRNRRFITQSSPIFYNFPKRMDPLNLESCNHVHAVVNCLQHHYVDQTPSNAHNPSYYPYRYISTDFQMYHPSSLESTVNNKFRGRKKNNAIAHWMSFLILPSIEVEENINSDYSRNSTSLMKIPSHRMQ